MGYYHGHRKRGFDFGDFEITKREILASVSIIAVMLLIGVLISGKISEYQMDKMVCEPMSVMRLSTVI